MNFSEILTTTSALMQGFGAVAVLFFVTLALSLPLGFVLVILVRSRFAPVRWVTSAYIYVIRSTPLMLQLFFIYFGLPMVFEPLKHLGGLSCALIGFVLNYAAYFAEIFRGGLLSIDQGQYEACQVLGMSRVQTTVRVILPQMFRVALPSITNESITLVKDTALVFAISVPEILHYAKVAVSRTGSVVPYVIAFVIYLVVNSFLQLLLNKIEKKIAY